MTGGRRAQRPAAQGPLTSLKILEFAGQGPAPFCGMLLADLGADVVRIDRPGTSDPLSEEIMNRGRRSITLDLKNSDHVAICIELAASADALIEGFRPGVMERLGLGPDLILSRNPQLVYGRVTGWGQDGPLAQAAGHDLNFIALSGALSLIGTRDRPVPPLAAVGDIGGGALFLMQGILAGIIHARSGGKGQVVDAAIVDGAASMVGMIYGRHSAGSWIDQRESNVPDGGAHFYRPYRCSDGGWITLAAFEPRFYKIVVERTGLSDPDLSRQMERSQWPLLREELEAIIATRTRDEWCEVFARSDACFAPVLTLDEAPRHEHNAARGTFVTVDGVLQPGPAPRFSATPGRIRNGPGGVGADGAQILRDWGVDPARSARLDLTP